MGDYPNNDLLILTRMFEVFRGYYKLLSQNIERKKVIHGRLPMVLTLLGVFNLHHLVGLSKTASIPVPVHH